MFEPIRDPKFVLGYIKQENHEVWKLTLATGTKIITVLDSPMEAFGYSPEDAYHKMLKMTASLVTSRYHYGLKT